MLGVLERRAEDVDLRWWRGWRCLGKRERRRRGLGMEDRFTPLLRANPGGGSITPMHGSGYRGPSPEGGGRHTLTSG